MWYRYEYAQSTANPRMSEQTVRRLRGLRSISSRLPVMAFAVDREGQLSLVQANPVMARRYTPTRLRGRHLRDLGLDHDGRLEQALTRILSGEAIELRLPLDDGQIEVQAWPTYDRDGAIVGAFGVAILRDSLSSSGMLGEIDSVRLRETLDSIEDGYYEMDLRGNFLVVNDALARLIGLTRDRLMGEQWPYDRLTDGEYPSLMEQAFNEVYRTKEPVQSIETQLRRADGTERTIDLSISPVLNSRGRVTGFRGIVRDVTERKQFDDELARRMELLAVLEQVDTELSQTLDVDNVLTVGITALVLLSHADAAEIVMRDERTDVFVLARHRGFEQSIELVPQTMGILGRVLRDMKPDLTLDVTADPDYYAVRPTTRAQMTLPMIAHNRLLGVASLEADDPARFTPEIFEFTNLLTARMAAAIENARLYQLSQSQLAELRGLYEQVSALEQIKTDMIRIASHDLRSPLGIIVGYLDLLLYDLEPTLNAEQKGFFEAMKRAADRMQRMTTDILSLERVQTVRMQTHVRLHLEQLARKVVDDFEDNAAHKGVTIVRNFSSDRIPIVGDPISLSEAIGNLVGNAIKYTPPGGTVEIRLARGRKSGELLVIDTGIGIRDEDQEKLFSPFYRVKNDETHGIEGTGLGLYLVKKIVEQHSGELIFKSAHGEGSTFGFRLPMFVTAALGASSE